MGWYILLVSFQDILMVLECGIGRGGDVGGDKMFGNRSSKGERSLSAVTRLCRRCPAKMRQITATIMMENERFGGLCDQFLRLLKFISTAKSNIT